MAPHLQVDLSKAPEHRWEQLASHRENAGRLVDSYADDLGGLEAFGPLLADYRAGFVADEYQREINAIAALIDRSPDHVLLANLYYDAFRAMIGCTAFAIDTPAGPLHARNLDWWTQGNMLSDYTLIAEVTGAACPSPYKLATWPGSVGAFSGVAEGRFGITLNAVISDETPQLAESITLLIRRVFDTAPDYEAALRLLADTPIAADCLLLVTGVRQGDMAVVERTSSRAKIRPPTGGLVVVTNDYRALDGGATPSTASALHATACARYDRARALASGTQPASLAACFDILQDRQVQMDITVQHMVMQASTGLLEVRLPGESTHGH